MRFNPLKKLLQNVHSVDVSKNGVDQEPHSLESQCEWQRELDACLGPDEMRLCLKAENLRKVFPDQDAADNISEYGMLKFKCGEGRDLWNRHSECLNFRNSTAKFMEQIAKCASGKNFLIFFQSFLKRESRVQMSLPCRFLKSIISCVEEAAVAQCGPEAKPMFCKFFQLAPFQQFLVGDRQGIASELKNCPVEVSHCSQE
ncbi:hypothetical protein L596_011283 [Steinernema carpocapsae]|nr:hypothetical protein L596_011283 [Steinernema carpocapsae]